MERVAAWLWPFALAASWLAGLLAAFGVVAGVQLSPGGDLRWDLGVLLGLGGVLGLATTVLLGRWLFGASLRPIQWSAVAIAVSGIVLAIAQELTLHAWAGVHIGQYDADNIGVTWVLSMVVLLVAVTAFGALIAPREARIGSGLAQAGAAALVLLIVIANVPGLGDGIEPESWPLAILIGLCGLYAVGAVVIGAWTRARG